MEVKIKSCPDKELRFMVNENLDLMVFIPDNYKSLYQITLEDGYLKIIR